MIEADRLELGARFRWCGRLVTLERVELAHTGRGRYLVVDDAGETRRLHYYDHERVELAAPAPPEWQDERDQAREDERAAGSVAERGPWAES